MGSKRKEIDSKLSESAKHHKEQDKEKEQDNVRGEKAGNDQDDAHGEKNDDVLDTRTRAILRHDWNQIDDRMHEYDRLLSSLGADECWHKHSTFKDHLVNVWKILALWRQPTDVCRLGLFHSTYSNSFVNLALFKPNADRSRLSALVGESAEQLVHEFCVVPRQQLVFEICWKRYRQALPKDGVVVKHIRDGSDVILSQRKVALFLLMTIADYSDQWYAWQDELLSNEDGEMRFEVLDPTVSWPGLPKPGLWMSSMSELGRLVRQVYNSSRSEGITDEEMGFTLPPVFDNCSATLTPNHEREARDLYWKAVIDLRGISHSSEALVLLEQACALNPFPGEFWLARAQIELIHSNWKDALLHARRGRQALLTFGTAYDKRMGWEAWVSWSRVLVLNAKAQTWPKSAWGYINLGLVDL